MKINIKADDYCAFCKRESEDIEQVFLFFKDVLLLWNTLSQHIYRTTAIRVLISTMPYCELPSTKHNKVVNFLYCRQNNSYSYVWRRKKHQYLQLSYVKLDLDTKWKNIMIAYINPKNKTSSFFNTVVFRKSVLDV